MRSRSAARLTLMAKTTLLGYLSERQDIENGGLVCACFGLERLQAVHDGIVHTMLDPKAYIG